MATFISEFFKLAKMLFDSKPKDFNDLELYETKYFPFKGYKYLCWCGRCVYRTSTPGAGQLVGKDKNHENTHLRQAQDCKTWISYYLKYVWSWFIISPWFGKKGYYMNKYETEAYAKEADDSYLDRRVYKAVDMFE